VTRGSDLAQKGKVENKLNDCKFSILSYELVTQVVGHINAVRIS